MSRRTSRITSARVELFWHYVLDGESWFRQSRLRRVRVRDRRDTSAVFPSPSRGRPAAEPCDACLAGQEHSRGYHVAAARRSAALSTGHAPSYGKTLSGWAMTSTQTASPVAGSYSAMPAVNRWRTMSLPSGARAGYSSDIAGPRVSPRR